MKLGIFVLLIGVAKATSIVKLDGIYKFTETVQLSDKGLGKLAYQITATAKIFQLNSQLYSAELKEIKLHVTSKKSPIPGTFKEEKSLLETADNKPFFVEIDNGVVKNVYISSIEDQSIVNLKKGFSSLLQITKSVNKEADVSGTCNVKYEVLGKLKISKTKTDCQTGFDHAKKLLGGHVSSERSTDIIINNETNKLEAILARETHNLNPVIADFPASISTSISLEIVDPGKSSIDNESTEDILLRAQRNLGGDFKPQRLTLADNVADTKRQPISKFFAVLKDNRRALSSNELGNLNSATAALKVISSAKHATYDEITTELKSKANKKIRAQLMDILGAVQTSDSHKAAMNFLKVNSKDYNLDNCERYLWALSVSPVHNKLIIEDLIKFSRKYPTDMKLYETLIQTISSMVRKYTDNTKNHDLIQEIVAQFSSDLRKCKTEDELCQRVYLKAFTNLASQRALEVILDYALNAPRRIGFRAMKALWSLGTKSWDANVLKVAERVFLANGTYDSSARTLALDILLATKPSDLTLSKILSIFKQKGSPKELKEYVLQRLTQISEKCNLFQERVKSILSSEDLYNYNMIAQGGLSTAFDRRFMAKGYLSTTQEVMSGILKRGSVHVNLDHNNTTQTVFTLGLFSNGLGSFVSSNEDTGDDDETNAGLELEVLGVGFRPFIFFEGQGELMGHVISGAGSTLTPAYQAVLLLEDDVAYIPLAVGALGEVRFTSVASVDLSGKIEINYLWNRNAESLVQNRAGIILEGIFKIDTPFIISEIETSIKTEPQLRLSSHIDFSKDIALCLLLEQPTTTVEYKSVKVQKNPFNKRIIKKMTHIKTPVPGQTYALNSKNNEMCNVLL